MKAYGIVIAAALVAGSLHAAGLSKYKDWSGYEQMGPLNIEGMYRLVQANRRPN